MHHEIDISASDRVASLTRLMADMAGVTDARAALELFKEGMRRTYPPVCAAHVSTRGLAPGQYRIVRLTSADGRDHGPAGGPWDYQNVAVRDDGILSELTGQGRPRLIHRLDLSGDPALAGAAGACRSLVLVPVIDPELPVNWLALMHEDPAFFTVGDLEELILRANLLGAVTKRLHVGRQLEEANQRIAREIEQIARIQRTLLPSQLPEIPGLSIAAFYETFDRAGGDLYDFARMEGDPTTDADDRWAILIADASGHGPAAATVCAIVHSILHAYPREPDGPAQLLGHVNEHLCAKQIESSFVTAFLAFYAPASRELVCARAGHNPPLVMTAADASGQRRVRRALSHADGLPLGIDADAPYTEERLTLAPGELVVLYTDGISEARDAAGEQFGPEGIERALANGATDARAAVRLLTEAVRAHQGARRTDDDQTILILEGVP